MTAAPPPAWERKSDRTRAAILRAARAQFQSHGYDRASIRSIAAGAAIDPSMVMRYFGSKAGLFAAATAVDLQLPELASVPVRHRGRVLVEHFVARWEGDEAEDVLVLLLRSAVTNEDASERLRDIFETQLVSSLSAAVGLEEARRRAGLIASQMLGLALCRYVLGLPGLAERSADELVADLAPTIQRYLSAPLLA